jgi:hypothetical protein
MRRICFWISGIQGCLFFRRVPSLFIFSTFCLHTTLRQAQGGAKRSMPTRPSSSLRMPLRALGRLGCCSTEAALIRDYNRWIFKSYQGKPWAAVLVRNSCANVVNSCRRCTFCPLRYSKKTPIVPWAKAKALDHSTISYSIIEQRTTVFRPLYTISKIHYKSA